MSEAYNLIGFATGLTSEFVLSGLVRFFPPPLHTQSLMRSVLVFASVGQSAGDHGVRRDDFNQPRSPNSSRNFNW